MGSLGSLLSVMGFIVFIAFFFIWMYLKKFDNFAVPVSVLVSTVIILSFVLVKSDYGCLYIDITEGTVYDKKVIAAELKRTLYSTTYIPTRYRLYIVDEIEINGEVYQRYAQCDVSEDTYYRYSVGDWFDSQNPWKSEAVEEKGE